MLAPRKCVQRPSRGIAVHDHSPGAAGAQSYGALVRPGQMHACPAGRPARFGGSRHSGGRASVERGLRNFLPRDEARAWTSNAGAPPVSPLPRARRCVVVALRRSVWFSDTVTNGPAYATQTAPVAAVAAPVGSAVGFPVVRGDKWHAPPPWRRGGPQRAPPAGRRPDRRRGSPSRHGGLAQLHVRRFWWPAPHNPLCLLPGVRKPRHCPPGGLPRNVRHGAARRGCTAGVRGVLL